MSRAPILAILPLPMMALVAKIRANLTAKIVLLVCASEVVLLAALGAFWVRDYTRGTRERLAAKMAVPGALMSQMALGFDAVVDLGAMTQIVQEKVVDAFVARRTGDVYFASDPEKIGRPYTEFVAGAGTSAAPGGGKLWESRIGGARHLTLVVPLRHDGDELGHLFLQIDATGATARERHALLLVLAGSAAAVLLTMAITGFWVNRLFVPRIDRTVAVLDEVRAGRYSARVDGPGAPDQIGRLMLSVDAMVERIEAHTADLRALARSGKACAGARSRSDVQAALLAAIEERFGVAPAGVFELERGDDAQFSAYQRALVAAGDLVLVGAGARPGADSARLYVPATDRPGKRMAIWFAVSPAANGLDNSTEFFLRALGGLVNDAVGRVDALARLRSAEQEYRDLFDNAVEGIFKLAVDGTLVAANPALAHMLGCDSPSEMLARFSTGSPGSRWVDLGEREQFLRRLRESGEVRGFEARLRRIDGTTLWASLSARAVRGRDGSADGYECSVSDVAERRLREAAEVERRAAEVTNRETSGLLAALGEKNRQLEETFHELQQAQARLVRTEKLAAMGTMAAGVAHDLNNILSGVVGYPDLLLMDLPSGSPLRGTVEAIRESGLRAAAVVADLLTLARGAAYALEPCDLNRLVQEYLQSPEHLAIAGRHPGVCVATRLSSDVRPIRGSRVHLQKVLMNLVMNALEAIHDEGSVTIATANQTIVAGGEAPVDVAPGEYVVLVVEDTGPGISEADLDHVFEPFFTKKVLGRSGTGLGLTVVLNTVQEHGGGVVAHSGATGASFTVLLPAAAADDVSAAVGEVPAERLRGSGRVLVVDDEPNVRHLATRMLTALGYTVDAVASGEGAVAWLRERSADLVLLDMLMPPGMTGCETYREIARLRPGQKAVICSGFAPSADYDEACRLGAGRFLKKPFGMTELGLAVREELESDQASGTA